jgi:hypothetical protein
MPPFRARSGVTEPFDSQNVRCRKIMAARGRVNLSNWTHVWSQQRLKDCYFQPLTTISTTLSREIIWIWNAIEDSVDNVRDSVQSFRGILRDPNKIRIDSVRLP